MFEEKYRLKKSISTFIFLTLWIVVFGFYSIKNNFLRNLLNDNIVETIIFLSVTILFLLKSIWTLLGEVMYRINNKEITVTKVFLGIKVSKKYNIHDINDIKIERRKSSTYWGGGGFRIYDDDEEILIMHTHGKEVKIGKDLANFQAKKIYQLLNNTRATK